MVRNATITFYQDQDGQFMFPLIVWVAEMKTQGFLGMEFCQKQVSGVHFDLQRLELKNPSNSVCFGCFHLNKLYPHSSQILNVRVPYMMYIDTKSARCSK